MFDLFKRFAGHKETYKEVSNLFDMTISSVNINITHFLEFLFEISTEYIKFPKTDAEKFEISRSFSQVSI